MRDRFLIATFISLGSQIMQFTFWSKLCIPSTLNTDLILWHTHLIVYAVNKSWFKSWIISSTFQAYTLPHTLNGVCVSLFKFHIIEYKFHLNCLEHSICISLNLIQGSPSSKNTYTEIAPSYLGQHKCRWLFLKNSK